jgi:glycogen debranching enzyme
MISFSGSLASKDLPTTVSSQQDVDTLIDAFAKEVKELNLWQYYVLDPEWEQASVKAALIARKVTPLTGSDVQGKSVAEIADIVRASSGTIEGYGQLAGRLVVHVSGDIAAGIVKAAFINIAGDPDALAEAWGRIVGVLNVSLYAEWEEDTRVALESVKNRLKYIRLEEGGPKLGEINEKWVLYEVFIFGHC